MNFGNLELTPLSDGFFRLDGGAMFGVVPKPLWERRAPADERNRIRLAIRPLLVRGERTMIIDAGIGDEDGSQERRHLRDRSDAQPGSCPCRSGLSPADIDIVLASHLHFDHAGGFTTRRSRRRCSAHFHARGTSCARRNGRMRPIHTNGTAPATCRRTSFRSPTAGVLDLVPGDERSCRASASFEPAATRCTIRSS